MPQFRAGQRLTVDLLNLLTSNPFKSDQIGNPAFTPTGSWVDFPDVDFPSIDIDIPDGARIKVTVSARCVNGNTDTSTCYLSWRASGANTIADQFNTGVGAGGGNSGAAALKGAIVRACNQYISNALAGGLTTITPQWQISSGSGSTASLTNGHLIVEVLP